VSDPAPEDRQRRINLRTTRMEAFSDGVFAIAITLLVLEIAVPELSDHVGRDLLQQWPIYLAYVVSFASIGNAWLSHSMITEYLEGADSVLLRLNLLLLLFVGVLPYPTHLLSEYVADRNAERIAVTIYGLNLLAIAGCISMLWHYALSEGLVHQNREDAELRALTKKLTPSMLSYVVVLVVGLLFPRPAVALYLAIALFVMIPFRTIASQLRRRR